jgi:hypothetical protein
MTIAWEEHITVIKTVHSSLGCGWASEFSSHVRGRSLAVCENQGERATSAVNLKPHQQILPLSLSSITFFHAHVPALRIGIC